MVGRIFIELGGVKKYGWGIDIEYMHHCRELCYA